MATVDLPDYTRVVTVSVEVTPAQIGPINTAVYVEVPPDLEDGERTYILTDIKGNLFVIPRPKGGVNAEGNVTTTDTYQTIVTRTVTAAKKFHLAKILISCSENVQYKLRWNGVDIGAEVIVPANTPWTDWFPWDAYDMEGDGAKAFDIQVKYPSGGDEGECYAEIIGEEI